MRSSGRQLGPDSPGACRAAGGSHDSGGLDACGLYEAAMSMWTHERRVAIRSAKSLHARPVALLVAHLLKVPPGTRFGFAGYRGTGLTWSVEDFGEAHAASVFKVWGWSGAQEVTVLACGPHAEYVLATAEAIFGRAYGPDIRGGQESPSGEARERSAGAPGALGEIERPPCVPSSDYAKADAEDLKYHLDGLTL
jgi:hypothetical protein